MRTCVYQSCRKQAANNKQLGSEPWVCGGISTRGCLYEKVGAAMLHCGPSCPSSTIKAELSPSLSPSRSFSLTAQLSIQVSLFSLSLSLSPSLPLPLSPSPAAVADDVRHDLANLGLLFHNEHAAQSRILRRVGCNLPFKA